MSDMWGCAACCSIETLSCRRRVEALQRKFNEETRGAKLELVLFQVRQTLGPGDTAYWVLYILVHTLCMVHIRRTFNDKESHYCREDCLEPNDLEGPEDPELHHATGCAATPHAHFEAAGAGSWISAVSRRWRLRQAEPRSPCRLYCR